jgi:hypothetical protein
MQRTTLILRYGIGRVRSRSAREAAQLLDVSKSRLRLLEGRGVRSLSRRGQGAACAGTGIAQSTLVAVYELLGESATRGQGLPSLLETGARLAEAAAATLEDEGEAAVAGVRESGTRRRDAAREPEKGGLLPFAGPALGDPFEDASSILENPLFLILVAITVACLASAAREIRRAVR